MILVIYHYNFLVIRQSNIDRKKKTEQYWVIPGGGLEAHEGYEEAAKRELKEELGYPFRTLVSFA